MRYRKLGRTGLLVSEIGLGALEIGRPWGISEDGGLGQPPTSEDVDYFLNQAIDRGVNFIDTACAYWASEERIGASISHRRDEYVLATKWGEWCDEKGSIYDYSPKAMWAFLNSSLKKLKTDVIDLYQIHSASPEVIKEGYALEEMLKAREQGKIRFIGCSCGEEAAMAAIECGGFDSVQVSYNILYRDMEARVFNAAKEANVGVIIKDGLAGGRLTEKHKLLGPEHDELKNTIFLIKSLAGAWGMSLPDFAIRFVLAQSAVSTVIVGTKSLAHLEENLRASNGYPLTAMQLEQLFRIL